MRLGDDVTFEEPSHVGYPGEKTFQEGFIHSLEPEASSGGLAGGGGGDGEEERGEIRARCSYKKHTGFLSAAMRLSELSLVVVPQQPQQGSSRAGGAGSNGSGANAAAAGKGKQPAGRSSSGKPSSAAGAGSTSNADRSAQSWGQGRCEHVAAGVSCNHKNGKVGKRGMVVGAVCFCVFVLRWVLYFSRSAVYVLYVLRSTQASMCSDFFG